MYTQAKRFSEEVPTDLLDWLEEAEFLPPEERSELAELIPYALPEQDIALIASNAFKTAGETDGVDANTKERSLRKRRVLTGLAIVALEKQDADISTAEGAALYLKESRSIRNRLAARKITRQIKMHVKAA